MIFDDLRWAHSRLQRLPEVCVRLTGLGSEQLGSGAFVRRTDLAFRQSPWTELRLEFVRKVWRVGLRDPCNVADCVFQKVNWSHAEQEIPIVDACCCLLMSCCILACTMLRQMYFVQIPDCPDRGEWSWWWKKMECWRGNAPRVWNPLSGAGYTTLALSSTDPSFNFCPRRMTLFHLEIAVRDWCCLAAFWWSWNGWWVVTTTIPSAQCLS